MPASLTVTAQNARRALLPLFILGFLNATGAFAAGAIDADVDSLLATSAGPRVRAADARLQLDNRDIVTFRAEFMGYSPARRAEAAEERLRAVIRAHPRDDEHVDVSTRPHEMGVLFQVDGVLVFGVLPDDRDKLTGQSFEDLVATTKRNLEDAVAAGLEQRTTSRLVRSIVLSVVATILLVLALRGLIWLQRWARERIHTRVFGRAKPVGDTHAPMVRQLGTMVRGFLRAVAIILALVLVDVWLTFVLKQFPYTYPWGDQIDDFLIRVTSGIGLAILRAIPNLVILVIILLLARFVDRWVKVFFGAVRDGRVDPPFVDADTAIPVQRLVVLFVWVVAIAIAYPFIPGSGGIAFKGLSVLLGVMISLGSSNVVSQAASGYMIMFSKALRPNDYVRIGDYEGTIMSIGMLSTKLRTPRDEEINVPNALVVGTTIKNYTRLNRETGAPVTTSVTIGYGAPWRLVHDMLLEAAAQTPGLRKDPAPRVLQSSLSDFYVEYTLLCRLDVPQSRYQVLSDLHANIQDNFNVHGVQIMSPHYEGDPDDKVWVPKDKWYPAPSNERTGSAASTNPRTPKGSS